MQIFQGAKNLPHPLDSSVVTIGNFDGVHRGHQELIRQVLSESKKWGVTPVVVTFKPHPSRILTPDRPVLRLFDYLDQQERLALLGVQILLEEPFTLEFSRLRPEAFFDEYIVRPLRPKVLVVGHDFAFGSNRKGTHEFLESMCRNHGIQLSIVPAVEVGGEAVSSSRIREVLSKGQVDIAAHLLARPYYLKGEVILGEQRGRKLGIPTANMRPLMEFTPQKGVYISRTHAGSQSFSSITNLGVNPTFHQEPASPLKVETHLFDFAGDLYGHEIRVDLLKFIRDEIRFASVDQLKEQIQRDFVFARNFFDENI